MSNSGAAARGKPHSVRQALLLGCVVALLGTACGQRGPLYLPQPESQSRPQPAAPAAAADAQKEAGEAEEKSTEEKDDE